MYKKKNLTKYQQTHREYLKLLERKGKDWRLCEKYEEIKRKKLIDRQRYGDYQRGKGM